MNPTLIIPLTTVFLLALMERAVPLRRARLLRPYFLTDIFYVLTGFGVGGWLAISYISHMTERAAPYLAGFRWTGTGFATSVLIALVLLDLGNYLAHVMLHRYEFLWEFHKAHHSSRHLDWLATFRSHIVEQLFRRFLAPVLLIIGGFPAQTVAVAGGLFLAWGIFNHSNLSLRLPWLSFLFITPALHRMHHVPGSDHRNFGTVLSVWDRLRGSLLTSEADSNAILGVPGEVETYPQSWGAQFIRPFQMLGTEADPELRIPG